MVGLLLTAVAVLGGPHAGADPQDKMPFCSGDQTPIDSNCQPSPFQVFTEDSPGANPSTPIGLNPGLEPLI